MKKWVLIIISFLVLGIGFCCWYFHPRVIFQRKFYFELPKSAKIESQSYDLYYDGLEMKVRLDKDDYQAILDGIEKGKKVREQHGWGFSVGESDKYLIISYDKEMENFVISYRGGKKGLHGAKTRTINILITQDKANADQYFLYVYY